MTDYSKFPWDKCVINSSAFRVAYSDASQKVAIESIVNPNDVARRLADGRWIIGEEAANMSIAQLTEICTIVDNWITEQEQLQKYPMSADEAEKFLLENPGEHRLAAFGSWVRWYRNGGRGVEIEKGNGEWIFINNNGALKCSRYRLIESRNVPVKSPVATVSPADVE